MNKEKYKVGIKIGLVALVGFGMGTALVYGMDNSSTVYQNFLNELATNAKKQVGAVGYTDVKKDGKLTIAYLPIDEKGNEISYLSKPLRLLVDKDTAKADITAYYYQVAEQLTGYKTYQLYGTAYELKNGKYEKNSETLLATLYQSSSGERVTLSSFLESSLEVNDVTQKLKDEINKLNLADINKTNLLAQIDKEGIDSLVFAYTPERFSLLVEKINGELTTVDVPIQSILPYFKENLVLESYKALYQEKVGAVREQRNASRIEKLNQITQQINARPASKKVALTFDDGPDNDLTPQVLDTLKKHGVKATFYLVGSRVAGNEHIVKRMVAEGHELGNHSWSHLDLTKLSVEEAKEQVMSTQRAIEQASGGVKAKSLRPPYGAINKALDAAVDLPVAMWNCDSSDWKLKSAEQIVNMVNKTVEGGSVILIHDIHKWSADSVDGLITVLKNKGYELTTFSQLFNTNEFVGGIMYFGENDARIVGQ